METSESNRSPAALGGSLGQGRTLIIPLQWKCPGGAVHGCSRKMGHPSLCSGGQQVPNSSNSTRSAKLYQNILFLVPKISFWPCWQSFLLDLQHIQRVRAVYSCATTSPTFPSEAQHTSTGSVCFLLSTSRVFVIFRASFLAELPPCLGWLMLSPWSWLRVSHPALKQWDLPRWVGAGQMCQPGFLGRVGVPVLPASSPGAAW